MSSQELEDDLATLGQSKKKQQKSLLFMQLIGLSLPSIFSPAAYRNVYVCVGSVLLISLAVTGFILANRCVHVCASRKGRGILSFLCPAFSCASLLRSFTPCLNYMCCSATWDTSAISV